MHSSWLSILIAEKETKHDLDSILTAYWRIIERPATKEADNNDGISIVDVSEPLSPRYCFSTLGKDLWHGPYSEPVPGMVPLTAETYVRKYYAEAPTGYIAKSKGQYYEDRLADPVMEAYIQQLLPSFNNIPLVALGDLDEAWQGLYINRWHNRWTRKLKRMRLREIHPDVSSESESDSSNVAEDGSEVDLSSEITQGPSELSLLKIAMDSLLSKDGSCHAALAISHLQQPIPPSLRTAILISLKALPELSNSSLDLLITLLDDDDDIFGHKSLDLSSWNLTSAQVVAIVECLPELNILDLSHNPRVVRQTIISVLTAAPQLTRLLVIGCVDIKLEDIEAIERVHLHHRCEDIIHSEVFWRFACDQYFKHESPDAVQLSVISGHRGLSMRRFSPRLILQALTDMFALLTQRFLHSERSEDFYVSGDECKLLFAQSYRPPDVPFESRALASFPYEYSSHNQQISWVIVLIWAKQPDVTLKWGIIRRTKIPDSEDDAAELLSVDEFLSSPSFAGKAKVEPAALDKWHAVWAEAQSLWKAEYFNPSDLPEAMDMVHGMEQPSKPSQGTPWNELEPPESDTESSSHRSVSS
ncbi:hypothetical protein SISSUDRAFT_1004536 [Sistotremastrum suecicum HHB10207 ss-3]|uniref:Uncharacterized protein n=1 Tax=Sistotremastrum suecicum HHB10207 ss-3 TaxID=1314776 RepID=A0A166DM85_9AGAM|nr:hypothetical protein SISSUDRAFT_1004536 [Sistotremastrum suecicum HHB10207 ss-3]